MLVKFAIQTESAWDIVCKPFHSEKRPVPGNAKYHKHNNMIFHENVPQFVTELIWFTCFVS